METKISTYTKFILRGYLAIILLYLVGTIISLKSSLKIDLKSDFVSLLPENFESVKVLKKIAKRIGGFGLLSVGVESDSVLSNKRFVEDLVSLLNQELKEEIKSVDYRTTDIKDFYEKYALLYLSIEDLIRLKNELRDWIHKKKLEMSPFYFSLENESSSEEFNIQDLKQRYIKFLSKYDTYVDGYYTDSSGRLFAILIKPKYSPTNIADTKKFVEKINHLIEILNPKSYHPSMKIGLAGNYAITVEEYEAVKKDILKTFGLCVFLIACVIFLFFRSFRVLVVLSITLISAIIITFGITSIFKEDLIAMTGFLGAIVMGTAINYGIIEFARFFEEKLNTRNPEQCIDLSITKTLKATLSSALTTAIAFFSLSFAVTRSFNEFGYVGAMGIIISWIASYTLQPSLTYLLERIKPSEVDSGFKKPFFFLPMKITDRISYHYRFSLMFLSLALASGLAFWKYIPTSLEYDFSKLRSKLTMKKGAELLDNKINKIIKVSTTPAVIITDDSKEAKEVCVAIEKKVRRNSDPPIRDCINIFTLVPTGQKEKLKIINKIKGLIKNIDENWFKGHERKEFHRFKKMVSEITPLQLKDVPDILKRRFKDTEGREGVLVYVNPAPGKYLWDARNLFAFTDLVRRVKLSSGKVIKTSGEAVVFADLLRTIKKDAPFISFISFLMVMVVILTLFLNIKDTIYIAVSLVTGISIMLGLITVFHVKFNFLNFVVIPTAMGTAVDYVINIYQRAKMDGRKGMSYVLNKSGSAVLLCSLTTIIGYFTLITADTKILASYGELAITAEIACLLSALFLLPALLRVFRGLPL